MEIKKLDDACEIEYGTRVVQQKDGGTIFPVYGGGGATFNMDEYNREDCLVIARFAMSKQCTRFIKDKFFLNDSGLTVKPKNDEELNHQYLNYQLLYLNNSIYSLSRGTAQRNLNVSKFRNLEISYPKSLSDQIQIATILSKAENLISQRKESIRLLDEFLKSSFLEMFGNYQISAVKKLETIASITSGLTKGKKYNGKQTCFVPYMRVANVQDGFLELSEIKTIEASPNEIERYNLQSGDLLLTEGGDPDKLGRGTIWRNEINGCIFQNHIFRVRVKDLNEINPIFLSFQTGSSYGKRYFLKSSKQTTGIASINSTQLKNFPAVIPPIKLQTQFAQLVEKTEALKTQYKQSLQELENLYGALSQQAFKGELTVKPNII